MPKWEFYFRKSKLYITARTKAKDTTPMLSTQRKAKDTKAMLPSQAKNWLADTMKSVYAARAAERAMKMQIVFSIDSIQGLELNECHGEYFTLEGSTCFFNLRTENLPMMRRVEACVFPAEDPIQGHVLVLTSIKKEILHIVLPEEPMHIHNTVTFNAKNKLNGADITITISPGNNAQLSFDDVKHLIPQPPALAGAKRKIVQINNTTI